MSRAVLLALALAAVAGCGTVPPAGRVAAPEVYPDRSEPEVAFHTFLWAWREGDVETLGLVLGGYLRHELATRLDADGAEATAAWYRKDAEGLSLEEVEWEQRGQGTARVKVALVTAAQPRVEVRFTLFQRAPDGWAVGQRHAVR